MLDRHLNEGIELKWIAPDPDPELAEDGSSWILELPDAQSSVEPR
jgi:hypothetical protein